MFNGIIDYIFPSTNEQPEAAPEVAARLDDDDMLDGFVRVNKEGEEMYELVEKPEIQELDDDIIAKAEVDTRKRKVVETDAVKRKEEFNKARAKKANMMHLEAVMFADPVSGKDVRNYKSGRSTQSSQRSTVVRRVNTTSGTQRAKQTSGKSNDRKVHRACDIQDPFVSV